MLIYLASVMVATLAVQGRSLQEWVQLFVPPGTLRAILMYPLQHHNPVIFAKLLNLGLFIANMLLFLPVGMGIFLLFRRVFPDSVRKILLMALFSGLMLSTGIEIFQHLVPNRVPSVSDVIANTGGAVFGCYILCFRKLYWEIKTKAT